MSVKVKICGITNRVDVLAAVDAGADALGFMFYDQSPRHILIEDAAKFISQIPPFILRTGVFVNPTEELVLRAIDECGLNLLQFHGEETPEFCTQFGLMSMKAFRIRDAESLNALPAYNTDAWLLDAYSGKGLGGTGETFNWDLALEAKKSGKLLFLAGGLTPENVREAVRRVEPFGVDVSSGVESTPGRKDAERMRAFVESAKSLD